MLQRFTRLSVNIRSGKLSLNTGWINLNNPTECVSVRLDDCVPGSEHFRWREILWLHEWEIYAYPEVEHYGNLLDLCKKLELIRKALSTSLEIVSGYRPVQYNEWIGGATLSQHCLGAAVDFRSPKFSAEFMRQRLKPLLDSFHIRMENLPNSSWVHVDIREAGPGGRFFSSIDITQDPQSYPWIKR